MQTFICFNINGIRAHFHQLEAIIQKYQPDVIGLQETKVSDELFPVDAIRELGYCSEFHGQPGHYGVALLSRAQPLSVRKSFPGDGPDVQRRFIGADYALSDGSRITVLNGYFPQGESRDHPQKFPAKEKFYADLTAYLQQHHQPVQQLLLMGDMNIAPADSDVGIGEDNARHWLRSGKCCFLPEERLWYQNLTDWGLRDAHRLLFPDMQELSWFDYRSRGFEREPKRGLRIDHMLVTTPLEEKLLDGGIDYEIRALEKPSDHCPIWVKIRLS